MGLVVKLAKSFSPKNANEEDEYIQSGRIGLWKATKKHDPKKGCLTTLAWYCIRNEILNYLKWSNRKPQGLYHDVGYEPESEYWESIPDAKLSPDENKVVNLRYESNTFKEIGVLCGRTKDWAYSTWTSAARKTQKFNG
jgi:hypothetical protein